jgi:hypothetical protein
MRDRIEWGCCRAVGGIGHVTLTVSRAVGMESYFTALLSVDGVRDEDEAVLS